MPSHNPQIFLNAYPLDIPEHDIEARVISYDQKQLETLRDQYGDTHAFLRLGDKVFVFSTDDQYPVIGESEKLNLQDNYRIFCFLVKDDSRSTWPPLDVAQ